MEAAEPRQDHARRAVLSIVGFWGLGAVSAQIFSSPAGIIPHLGAIACGFVFFSTISQIAAEGTDLRPFDVWHGIPGYGKASPSKRRALSGAFLRPRWWRRVVTATGWPPALVVVLLVVAFAAAIVSVATLFIPLLGAVPLGAASCV